MAFKLPWSNMHELNLDWILEKIKELREDVDNISGAATPYTSTPEMDGIGNAGSAVSYARGDHRHPTDTSRASAADLAQEVLDRDGADTTLQTNIDATDAKIKFSSSAPYMDSSSASAGFSDYMARADHVHPTDTSRASATDLATLTARVDAFSGSAAPSDTVPLMDGVGFAGTGGNYSRGDHVHPSDSSKLDTAGGTITGALTVEGNLVAEKTEGYGQTDASGWLRIIKAPVIHGTRVDISIVRKGSSTAGEAHNIKFINNTLPYFTDEQSIGDVLYIDKIRYTSAGYIDIHMDQTYQADIGVELRRIAPTQTNTGNIEVLGAFTFVGDTPAGETVAALYTFSEIMPEANTTADGSYEKHADGTIIQYGSVTNDAGTGVGAITFPVSFANEDYIIICNPRYSTTYNALNFRTIPQKNGSTGAIINFKELATTTSFAGTNAMADWVVIGQWR